MAPCSRAAAAGGVGPSAGAAVAGHTVGTNSQPPPPAGLVAACCDTDLGVDSVAAAKARAAAADAEYSMLRHKQQSSKSAQHLIGQINSAMAQPGLDCKSSLGVTRDALQQLPQAALQQLARLQERQAQREQARAELIAKQYQAEGIAGSKEGSGYESESGSGEEADQEAQAVAGLGGLGISAWLAPQADWSCTQEQLSRYWAVTQVPGPSGEVLASHARSNLDLTRHDLQTLKPNDWLNDQSMNMYIALLQDRDAALRGAGGLCCHFFNTFFLNKLYRDANAYDYKNVQPWTLPARLKAAGLSVDCVLKCERIIIPVHEGNHWTALMVDVGAQRVVFFDSMAGKNRRAVSEVKRWLADEANDKLKWDTTSWAEVYPRDIPQQSNGVDCGVFALLFCNRMGLRDGAFDFRQADISVNVRAAIVHDLLEGVVQMTGQRS